MQKKDWNPENYLSFRSERMQPIIDLVSRIRHDAPEHIIDVGCGPGNSTNLLMQRWPEADILGIDSSQAMIEKAEKEYPQTRWRIAEAGTGELEKTFDIAFSNSAIQWIPDHPGLIEWFRSILNPGGTIAVQLPNFLEMPLGRSIDRVSKCGRWRSKLGGVSNVFTICSLGDYYDILEGGFTDIELWETRYVHLFNSWKKIFDMIYSTGLRPYLHTLESEEERAEFEKDIFEAIQEDYPVQKDGNVLFSFYRMFFIANKK